MKTGPTIARGKSKQNYPTPWEFIWACENKFGIKIELDLAASPENAKAPVYITREDNSLQLDWNNFIHPAWLNPPFGNIAPWAKKCALEADRGAHILFLTPASVGSNWFRDFVFPFAEVYALNGRITFEGASDPYPKDCMLSVFWPRCARRGFRVWTWPEDSY